MENRYVFQVMWTGKGHKRSSIIRVTTKFDFSGEPSPVAKDILSLQFINTRNFIIGNSHVGKGKANMAAFFKS